MEVVWAAQEAVVEGWVAAVAWAAAGAGAADSDPGLSKARSGGTQASGQRGHVLHADWVERENQVELEGHDVSRATGPLA